ncbi:fas-binding factor 1 isoform X7 [Physeter macrocephalus]|uniref:Fas-binding factor 1 isoform X7 n=1 Tax=Physeter macrocephalus TaxID=9755 RepID=A0A455AU13_PHYMC|nr:fas-binding factor 1 isoform X7 [Physeter catodon]|eukprot:XP_028340150.1 fas-binding factor 1 isoform X7 [Physeter catodon]
MAPKAKKGLKGSIDDVLGDLLGDETTPPEKPVKLASRARDATGAAQALAPSRARTKSLLEDDAFSTRAGLAGADAEVSDISDADPQALLQAMKDLDEMDADLLGLKKSNLASSKRSAKGSGKEEQPSPLKPAGVLPANEKRDAIPTKKLPPSPTSLGHQYRKFSFEDLEDPLAGLLSDDEEGIAKKLPGTESETASVKSPAPARDRGPSLPLTPGNTPVRKKEELLFDDGDDIMATLGFGDSPKAERRHTGDQEGPLPARSKLEELLGRGTAAKLLARPGTGEHREFKLDKKYQRPQDKENTGGDEDFTFGAYQPTVGSSDGRQSRRQSVSRFFEGGTDPKGEPGSRQSTPAASSPTQPRRGGADWLGLKDEGLDLLPSSPTREAPRRPPPASQHSAPVGLPSPGAKPPTEGTGSPAKGGQPCQPGASEKKAEEDWLSHALSRKKPQGLAREQHDAACKGQPSVGALPSDRQPAAGTQGLEPAAAGGTPGTAAQRPPARPAASGSPVTWNPAALPLHAGDPKRGAAPGDCSGTEPAIGFPSSQEPPGLSVPVQPLLPESLAWSLLPGSEYQQQLLAAQAQLQRGTAELQADHLQSQARLAELEAQVRKLELERTQHQLLLESLQQRHQADLELIDSAHRSRVKVLETSYQQREERLRRENEELSAQYLSRCQEAEQARAELTAQHQRRLAATAQEKDQEVERLRELQRASILEMRKDHEEQLQRLKLLKDREIDAVTSATSHTRSLNGIIEQMEKFSSSLHELSSRVEASHLSTAQERELGIRQRDEQLRGTLAGERRAVQGRVRAARSGGAEEGRGPADGHGAGGAGEGQDILEIGFREVERRGPRGCSGAWPQVSHHLLPESGRSRATAMRQGGQRVLGTLSRAQFNSGEETAERLCCLQEQAELKIRASELRAKEDQLAAEREALEQERQELWLEKERVSAAAQRIRLRAEEVESMSQVASQKYEEGERALREARQVQSEQQARLQLVQQQQERLRQRERHVHQEHLSLAQQRLQLDRIRQDLPSGPVGLLSRAQGPAASGLSAIVAPAPPAPQCSQLPAGPGPSHLHAKLVLLKHTAEQDRDFLENEQFFLEALKKASYNMTSHSA